MEGPHWVMQHRLQFSACRLCRNLTRAALSMPVTLLQGPHRLPWPMHARSEQTHSCATLTTPYTVMPVRLLLRYPLDSCCKDPMSELSTDQGLEMKEDLCRRCIPGADSEDTCMQMGGNVQQVQQQMDERQNVFKELQAELDARNAAEAAAARMPVAVPIPAPAYQDRVSIIFGQSRARAW